MAVSRFAHLLIELGVKKGGRVLLLLPNLPQAVVAYYGTLRAGAVAVSTTPLSEPEELIRQANDSGARVLVTLDRNAAAARLALDASKIERVILANVGDYLPVWARPFTRPPSTACCPIARRLPASPRPSRGSPSPPTTSP